MSVGFGRRGGDDVERARELLVIFHQHFHLAILWFAGPGPILWKHGDAQALDVVRSQSAEPGPHGRLPRRVRVHRRRPARAAELPGRGRGCASLLSVGRLGGRLSGATPPVDRGRAVTHPVLEESASEIAFGKDVGDALMFPPVLSLAGQNCCPFYFSSYFVSKYPILDCCSVNLCCGVQIS